MSHNHDHGRRHGHDHGHGHDHNHDHNHDHSDDITPALQNNLYKYIRFDDVVTLNENVRDTGMAIVKKTWAERLTTEPELASNADEQLIMHVPFTGQVKLHSILIRSSPALSAPRTLRVFVNRDDIDFDTVEDLKPAQEFELSRTSEVQEIPVKRAIFSQTQRLTLFFVDNFAAPHGSDEEDDDDDNDADSDECEHTILSYIGFKGEWMPLNRAPVNVLYEAAPNPADHALQRKLMDGEFSRIR